MAFKYWFSCAQWPEGTLGGYNNDISTDKHISEANALSVTTALSKQGFGGERKVFPVKTWVHFSTHPQQEQ